MMKSKRYVEYFQQDIHLYDYSSTDILPKCSLLIVTISLWFHEIFLNLAADSIDSLHGFLKNFRSCFTRETAWSERSVRSWLSSTWLIKADFWKFFVLRAPAIRNYWLRSAALYFCLFRPVFTESCWKKWSSLRHLASKHCQLLNREGSGHLSRSFPERTECLAPRISTLAPRSSHKISSKWVLSEENSRYFNKSTVSI